MEYYYTKERSNLNKTRRAIISAYKQLVCERESDPNRITVSEICDRAEINRKTFYRYYTDLEDLIVDIQLLSNSRVLARKYDYTNKKDLEELIRTFFEVRFGDEAYFDKIYASEAYSYVIQGMIDPVVMYRIKSNMGKLDPDENKEAFLIRYFCSVSSHIYHLWVIEGKKISREELVEMSVQLINNGFTSFIDMNAGPLPNPVS